MKNIAVVIPTIREELYKKFLDNWSELFYKHKVKLITVWDGDDPKLEISEVEKIDENKYLAIHSIDGYISIDLVIGEHQKCLSNHNAGIRNLGFAYIARFLPEVEFIITLDDDEEPMGDTIADHIEALNSQVPVSWMSTASKYTRGFPYAVRNEAEVVISHGVWEGVADWDAPTQLVNGNQPIEFYKGPIPKGIYYPMCSMNLAFKRKILPYLFHAPWSNGVNRFDDIFAGIVSKQEVDKRGWAVVTGFARVKHERASNVFTNLKNEVPGILLNETFWQGDKTDPYFEVYKQKYEIWMDFINTYGQNVK